MIIEVHFRKTSRPAKASLNHVGIGRKILPMFYFSALYWLSKSDGQGSSLVAGYTHYAIINRKTSGGVPIRLQSNKKKQENLVDEANSPEVIAHVPKVIAVKFNKPRAISKTFHR